jgi:hypothetical protein
MNSEEFDRRNKMNAEDKKVESQIAEKVNELSKALEVLQENVCNICDRLSTVLIPVDSIDGKEEVMKEPVLCPLASTLGYKVSEVWAINKKLSDTLYRLGL